MLKPEPKIRPLFVINRKTKKTSKFAKIVLDNAKSICYYIEVRGNEHLYLVN